MSEGDSQREADASAGPSLPLRDGLEEWGGGGGGERLKKEGLHVYSYG